MRPYTPRTDYVDDDPSLGLFASADATRIETGIADVDQDLAILETDAARRASNLSDLESASAARDNLGLGGAAEADVGTTAGTVAAGNDSRITGAAQKAANLSDLGSAAAARSNLGLGTAAPLDVPASGDAAAGQVVKGSDSRLTNTRTPTSHAASHGSGGSDPVTPAAIGAATVGHSHSGDFDPAGTASSAVTAHEGAADPHAAYQRESEKDQAGGYAGLDGSGLIPDARIPAGIARDSEVTSAVSTHEGLPDPHAGYQLESDKGAASGYAGLNGNARLVITQGAGGIPVSAQSGSYTAQLADAGTMIVLTSASAATFTVPTNAAVPFEVGTVLQVLQGGAGQVTLASSATLNPSGTWTTARQGSVLSMQKVAANQWWVFGDYATTDLRRLWRETGRVFVADTVPAGTILSNCPDGGGAGGTLTAAALRIHYLPWRWRVTGSIDRMALNVSTLGSGALLLGVHSRDAATGEPAASGLLKDFGATTSDASTTGSKVTAVAGTPLAVVEGDVCFLVLATQAGTTVFTALSASQLPNLGYAAIADTAPQRFYQGTLASWTGSLPSSPPALTKTANNPALIKFQYA